MQALLADLPYLLDNYSGTFVFFYSNPRFC